MLGLDPFHIANEGRRCSASGPTQPRRCSSRSGPIPRPRRGDRRHVSADHPGRLVLDTGIGRRLMPNRRAAPPGMLMDHIRMTCDGGGDHRDRPERFNSLDVATAQGFAKPVAVCPREWCAAW
jgi:hypothetical protein